MKDRRANIPEQKREIIERILIEWQKHPTLRLCQLIENCTPEDIFYVEDFDFIEMLENN